MMTYTRSIHCAFCSTIGQERLSLIQYQGETKEACALPPGWRGFDWRGERKALCKQCAENRSLPFSEEE